MKVVTANEMKTLDRTAIERGTPSLDLMERAGRGVADLVWRRLDERPGCVVVICGSGNNGGDGFVIARLLAERGARVTIGLAASCEKLSEDARVNFERAQELSIPIVELSDAAGLEQQAGVLTGADVVVDALFGTGLDRELDAHFRRLLELMNRSSARRIAVDIPSGLHADSGEPLGASFEADETVTFALPKVGLVSHPGFARAGRVHVVDIGISEEIVAAQGIRLELLEESDVRSWLPTRPRSAHKGTFGHVLVVAGSADKVGAAFLCGEAAMRMGAGLCTIASTPRAREALSARVIETMTACYAASEEPTKADLDRLLELAHGKDAVVLGPGIPTNPAMAEVVVGFVRASEVPLVIDADGLNLLVGRAGALRQAKSPVALTPHPGEMARLIGRSVAAVQADRIGVARQFASEHQVTVVLKGARTVIAAPDGHAWINPTGNPGLATGGSGDVLAGMAGALLGQGVPLPRALLVTAYLHGLAGDRGAANNGQAALIARDLLAELPVLLRSWDR